MKKFIFIPVLAAVLFSAACKKKEAEVTPLPVVPVVYEPTTMEVNGKDNMQYSGDIEFQAGVGQKITLTLKNIGTLPKAVMGHNLVVLVPGTDIQEFATAAMSNQVNDYIPPAYASSVIAHTNLLGPGEIDVISFTLTTAGVYDFICSFPGHSGTMHGTITVSN